MVLFLTRLIKRYTWKVGNEDKDEKYQWAVRMQEGREKRSKRGMGEKEKDEKAVNELGMKADYENQMPGRVCRWLKNVCMSWDLNKWT